MRRRKKREIDFSENSERWLLTYADLITLLLAFFIVMYSMSQVDAKKFGKISEALNGILKGGDKILDRDNEAKPTEGHGLLELGDLKILQKEISKNLKTLGKQEEVETEITERGLVIHILESALFKEGSSVLQPKAMDILSIVYNDIYDKPNHVRIEGHTDNRTVSSPIYPSNWELSTARATEVVRHFIDEFGFQADRISALGYGEYRPIKPNNSFENRSRNRRVDIVILTMELTLKEPTSQLYQFVNN